MTLLISYKSISTGDETILFKLKELPNRGIEGKHLSGQVISPSRQELSYEIMIRYSYKKPRILFVGINPHFGSFRRGVPFSNNKMFWYLLSDAGILEETRDELRSDEALRRVYKERFNSTYGLGLVNIINRPTRDITELKKNEELPGRRRISRIITKENPPVVCFIGKVAYEKYIGSKDFSFGWQEPINKSRIFVMHSPLRGEAIVRTLELRHVMQATLDHRRG